MRYTRLRRQIESGTLIGTHGTPFTGSADKIFEASTKRKRGGNIKNQGSSDTEDEEPVQRKGRKNDEAGRIGGDGSKNGGTEKGKGVNKSKGKEVKVKEELDSDFSSTESDFEDSEDEMPLAKLRKAQLGPLPPSATRGQPSSKPYISPYPSSMMTPGVSGRQLGGGEVPRSMPAFGIGQGGEGFGIGNDPRFGGLGSAFHSPVGRNDFVIGNGTGGWGEMDWARWQNRFGSKETNGSLKL